jgi:hypothetical protein
MMALREYREELAGMRLAGIASSLEGIGAELAANARVATQAISEVSAVSAIDNAGFLAEKKETERSRLVLLKVGAEKERASASTDYESARRDRMILDRLLERRRQELRASRESGDGSP